MRRLSIFVISFLLGGLTCTGASAAMKSGAYQVPVPESLSGVSRFQLARVGEKIDGDQLDIHYTLPPEIVGEPGIHIHLSGRLSQDGFSAVTDSSNGSEGYCLKSKGASRTCLIRYPGIKIDASAAEGYLRAHYQPSEISNRSQVVHIFKDDPAGILTIQ